MDYWEFEYPQKQFIEAQTQMCRLALPDG